MLRHAVCRNQSNAMALGMSLTCRRGVVFRKREFDNVLRWLDRFGTVTVYFGVSQEEKQRLVCAEEMLADVFEPGKSSNG